MNRPFDARSIATREIQLELRSATRNVKRMEKPTNKFRKKTK